MAERKASPAPCGTWPSPVTAGLVAASSLRLGAVTVDGSDIYWLEGRPMEAGRMVVVKRDAGGRIADVTPPGTNVRSRVHEYGSASYAVSQGVLCFVEFADQRLYRLAPGGAPEPLTADSAGDCYYADISIDVARRRIVCVREDHRAHGQSAINSLVIVPLGGPPTLGETFVEGHDFYSTPRLRPDGRQLCWLAWRHPQMPWEGTELWIADLGHDGAIAHAKTIAGSDTESIYQPGWTPDGVLYFASDRSGWWNLYRWSGGEVEPESRFDRSNRPGVFSVCPLDAEFGRPQWQLGTSTWAVAGNDRLAVTCGQKGHWQLATLDRSTGTLERVPCQVEPADSIAANDTQAVLIGGWTRSPDAVVLVDLATGLVETLRAASPERIDVEFLSEPWAIEFPTGDGLSAHGFFYAPRNGACTPMAGERPPLVVMCHGGPTATTYARLNLEVQFWTSRGFAVVDVNYGGSAGFGRPYRERLRGQWGVVDVDDCVNAATWLADNGHVDRHRMVIRGRSAGGYTTLAALAFRPGVFRTGASYYGIGDLERLAEDTHKFEKHYLDGLIGPYPAEAELYRARSPINFAERITCPLILFQGLEDRVVPPNQAALMAEAVRAQGHDAVLVTFEGEQHGFRKAETIERCLEAELLFYTQVLQLRRP